MDSVDPAVLDWLSSPENPPVMYLTALEFGDETPGELERLRRRALAWAPLQTVLARQQHDGSFPSGQKTATAQPSFSALALMQRCGMSVSDGPVRRTIDYLEENHLGKGALSYTSGGSGVLPCYLGVIVAAVIKMGGTDTRIVQSAIPWLVDHQRFDHKETRAGGEQEWPYRAPHNYGCWDSVSCYHGVAATFRAFAAVPLQERPEPVRARLSEALEYLRIHRLYRKTTSGDPLFRHMTQFFLVGDYRSHLLDMLEGLADADPGLLAEEWVSDALEDVRSLAPDGRVTLVKNYGRRLIYPLPVETVGEPSRFLTLQWLKIQRSFDRPLAA